MKTSLSILLQVGMAIGVSPILMAPIYADSSATFDAGKTITLQGTVRTWEMVAPHGLLWVYVTDNSGKRTLWCIEGYPPQVMTGNGWTKSTIKAGDSVTLLVNPLRDGRPGGNLVKMTLSNGVSLNGPQTAQIVAQ